MPLPAVTDNLVAAWCGKLLDGDHGGTYFDLKSRLNATVTRASAATIYDPWTGRIHDVAANLIPMNPWGVTQSGGIGYAPVIEEARTNYLVNSYGAANTAGVWDSWVHVKGTSGTPTKSIGGGVYGATAQRVQYTGDSDSNKTNQFAQAVASGFTAADSAAFSVYLKGSAIGCAVRLQAAAYAGSTYLGAATQAVTLTTAFARATVIYANLPATTDKVTISVDVTAIDTGDVYDITISPAQLEKGAFATSYIPTTTAAATRAATVVTVPTTGWNAAAGTIVAVADRTISATGDNKQFVYWAKDANDYIMLQCVDTTMRAIVKAAGTAVISGVLADAVGPAVRALTWTSGDKVYCARAGTMSTASATNCGTPTGLAATALIGNGLNALIQSVLVYDAASVAAASQTALVNGLKAGGMSPAKKLLLLGL